MKHGSGDALVGCRLYVQGYGAGTVTAFNRVYGKGASSHTIEFAEFGSCKIKLQRKTNRDPDKLPWLIYTGAFPYNP